MPAYYYFMEVYHKDVIRGKLIMRCKTFRFSEPAKAWRQYKRYKGMFPSVIEGCELYGPAEKLTEELKCH